MREPIDHHVLAAVVVVLVLVMMCHRVHTDILAKGIVVVHGRAAAEVMVVMMVWRLVVLLVLLVLRVIDLLVMVVSLLHLHRIVLLDKILQ